MKQILILLSLIMLSARVQAAALKFQSSVEKTSLLELYSSEGCNSCPPAEAWLNGLKDNSGLWTDFVPMDFHVEYWDYLGWRDPWSKGEFSKRQRAYAARWRSESVYTPGFVLNGREWTGWPGGKDALKISTARAGVLSATSDEAPDHWHVDFSPVDKNDNSQYEIHAALLGGGLSSDVKAGENRGRRLLHDFTVLNLVTKSEAANGGLASAQIALPRPSDFAGTSLALAVWITKAGSPEPVQATGGWIIRPPGLRSPAK